MSYVGQVYAQACGKLATAKSYPQAIACADKVVAMGDKVGDTNRLGALQTRVQAFSAAFDPKAADANDQLTKERDAALLGAKLLGNFAKAQRLTPRRTRNSRTRKSPDGVLLCFRCIRGPSIEGQCGRDRRFKIGARRNIQRMPSLAIVSASHISL